MQNIRDVYFEVRLIQNGKYPLFFLKPVRKWSGSAVKPTRAELVVSSCDLLITYSNEINEARSVAVNASALARWPQAELF